MPNFSCDVELAMMSSDSVARQLHGASAGATIGYMIGCTLGGRTQLAGDLTMAVPFTTKPTYTGLEVKSGVSGKPNTATVVGVIENLSWDGKAGSPIQMLMYVSPPNATLLWSVQQSTRPSTDVTALGFWIGSYDSGTKQWFEQCFPLSAPSVTGVVTSKNLNVDLTATPAKGDSGVDLCKIWISVAPPAGQSYTLRVAESPGAPTGKPWGG